MKYNAIIPVRNERNAFTDWTVSFKINFEKTIRRKRMEKCDCRKTIVTKDGPKAIGPYSVAVKACHFIYTAGQIGLDPATGNLVEGGVEGETHQAIRNLESILKAAGGDLRNVVKNTVFLRDINDFAKMNIIYAEYFKEDPPARSAFQVAALPKGAAIEIESVAHICDCDKKETKKDCCCNK
jgi:2-iminobutanoate/2-iminopropanoate deaminase